MKRSRLAMLMLGSLITALSGHATVATPGAAKFDLNRNGIIDKGVEIEVYIRHMASPILKEYDVNLNGRLDPAEADLINVKLAESSTLYASRSDIEHQIGEDPGLVVTTKPSKEKPERLPDVSGILIRKTYEPISAFALPGKFEAAGAALVSYKHDITSGNDSGSANGSLAAFKHWNINTDYQGDIYSLRATRAAVHAGLEFDEKLDQESPSKEIDILTFRAGAELELSGGLFDAQYWRLSAFDTTNSSFDGHVGGAEFEWEPVYNVAGIGNARQIGDLPISYRWRPVLHGEIQSVFDAGGNPLLTAADHSNLLGPIITSELWFEDGPLSGLYVDASYRYLFDFSGENNLEYFDVGASYNIDQAGHFALTGRYRVGATPKGRQDIEDITFGIGIKF